MRGLFNTIATPYRWGQTGVSIRLADAWPFQLQRPGGGSRDDARFNPPCGCVAFSTERPSFVQSVQAWVSIRLADAWPFQQEGEAGKHHAHEQVSIRLADAWPFQLRKNHRSYGSDGFQSALRMRGLFNKLRYDCAY